MAAGEYILHVRREDGEALVLDGLALARSFFIALLAAAIGACIHPAELAKSDITRSLIRIFDAILWFSHPAASVTGAKRSIEVRLEA